MTQPLVPESPRGDASGPRIVLATLAAVVAVAVVVAVILLARSTPPGEVAAVTSSPPGAESGPDSASSPRPGASQAPGHSTQPGTSVAPSATPGPDGAAEPIPADAPRLGRADASVVVNYWADYQCPFCATFARELIPELQPLIDDGTVALVHRDFAFLGPESVDAAVAARCAGDDYWAMHDAIYAAQQGENQGAFAHQRLIDIATATGLAADEFDACIDDRAIKVAVLDDTAAGIRQAVGSTPTIDVNGTRFNGVPPIEDLRAAIEAAAAGAAPAVLPSRAPIQDPWAGLPMDGRTVGDPEAPVTVDIWIDYQAPGSGVLVREIAPELRNRVAAGDIRLVLRDLAYLGQESVLASSTVRCVEAQGGPHWLVSDVLAAAGRGPDSQTFVPDTILRLVSQLGLDVKAFDTCMQDPAIAAMVEADTEAGRATGLESGPAVVIMSDGIETARFEGSLAAPGVLAAIDQATP